MNVSLTPQLEALVKDKVNNGLYHSASEVIREGLRLLQEQDEFREARLAELRKDIAVGIEQADRGDVAAIDVDCIKAKARRRKGNP